MTASGLSAQVGFAIETTPLTRVTPTRFLELTNESVKTEVQQIVSRGIRSGRRTKSSMQTGANVIGGDITVIAAPQGLGMLLQAAFGAVSSTGAGPYTHTFTPGNVRDDTLTVQFGKPRVMSSTVDVYEYTGAAVTNWSLSAQAGSTEPLAMTFGIAACKEDLTQSLASASYPSGYAGFVWAHGALTVAGSARDIISINVAGDNGLGTGRHRISATTPKNAKQAVESDFRSYTGSMTIDYDARTIYDLYVAGTDAALSLAFTSGSTSLTIAGNIRFTGSTPSITGPENLVNDLPFEFYSGTSDSAAITVTLVNADSTP